MPRKVEVVVADNTAFDRDFIGFRDEIWLPDTLEEYRELWETIERERRSGHAERWQALMRLWSAGDAYFNLVFVTLAGRDAWNKYLHQPHFWHPSHLDLAREIQFGGPGILIVGSRGLGKSTHAHADNIRRKYLDPNDATCIFSLTRELAEDHLGAIMNELRENKLLRGIWHDRFYWDPEKAKAPFGLKDGVRTKRSTTRPEESFEARAFVTRLPTGMHYDRRYYDDIEADSTVSSEITMATAEERYVSSQDLKSSGGDDLNLGTYYDPNGLLVKLGTEYGRRVVVFAGEDLSDAAKEGLEPEEAGPLGGRPSHGYTREDLWDRWREKGCVRRMVARASYGRQIACDPLAGEGSRFRKSFVRYFKQDPLELVTKGTIYVCQDPASGTIEGQEIVVGEDPVATFVWLIMPDKTFWWIDGWILRVPPARRKLLTYQTLLQWNSVGYVAALRMEQYGQSEAGQQQILFNADRGLFLRVEICNDNSRDKRTREWERWDAILAEGFYVPEKGIWHEDENGDPFNVVEHFLDYELLKFPKPMGDHLLDAGGLIKEPVRRDVLPLEWPAHRRTPAYDDDGDRRPLVQSLGTGGVL